MELKRFVLLSDKTILTKKEFESQRKVDLFYADRLFVKHSDNILDLVEGGDLVEALFTGNDTYYKLEVIKLDDKTIQLSHLTLDVKSFYGFSYSKNDFNIKLPFCKSIYKRQPNGDYKRYSIDV